jgi:hypothetical protein
MTSFNDPWYHDMIERYSPDPGTDPTCAHARCVLVAAALIAQSLDGIAQSLDRFTAEFKTFRVTLP